MQNYLEILLKNLFLHPKHAKFYQKSDEIGHVRAVGGRSAAVGGGRRRSAAVGGGRRSAVGRVIRPLKGHIIRGNGEGCRRPHLPDHVPNL